MSYTDKYRNAVINGSREVEDLFKQADNEIKRLHKYHHDNYIKERLNEEIQELRSDKWQYVFGGFLDENWNIGKGLMLETGFKYKIFVLNTPKDKELTV